MNDITLGGKIKKIRTFRGITQMELNSDVSLKEKGSYNLFVQYVTNYRISKRKPLDKIAEELGGKPPELLYHHPQLCRGLHMDIF